VRTCLKANTISKSFGSLKVIDSWNFEIKQGERVGLIGPSGCGKTSFLRIATGLDDPTEGSIERNWKNIGVVFQEPRLIPGQTVSNNISFISSDSNNDEVLDMLELTRFADYYPRQLSGGMSQRVNLARALVNKPDFLVLDEAFSAYDIDIKYRTIDKLVALWKRNGFTMVSVTHNLRDAVMLADRIILVSRIPSKILFEYRASKPEGFGWTCLDMYRMEEELTQVFLRYRTTSEHSLGL
jgi:ABC-type nitrate/sulfonate/bicarbonate transport system ATPase subunit